MTPHFTREELACKCGCGAMEFELEAVEILEDLRKALGFPFPIVSGYRCPEHNAKVSKTGKTGPHTRAGGPLIAVDIGVHGAKAQAILWNATDYGFTGFGVHQKGLAPGRFIHIDTLPNAPGQPRPWVWSY